ncbi:MAG: cytochrome P450 [Solirubrobacterales bacterium]
MSTQARSELPPGLPPGADLPRSRQTARWIARPVRFLQSLQQRHGDVFTLHLLQEPPWVMVADPELVRQIFTAPADVLHAGSQKRILEPVLGSHSVLLSDGEIHMHRRKLLLPPFQHGRLAGYEQAMRSTAEAEIDRWPLGTPGPAAPRMSEIALGVIMTAVFGRRQESRLAPLREAIERLVAYLETPSALVALGERSRLDEERFAGLPELLSRVDELLFAEIDHRRRHRAPANDVLSFLLEATGDDGSAISDQELRDELMTLIIAGHETTATSLSWAIERLARSPQALNRATDEAADGGGPYTDAVVQETLRLRSPFMVVPRMVMKPFQLGDLAIPLGVAVTPAIPLVHRRPDVYPDPDEFRPERFLECPPGTYTWIPFGGGVRRCLGAGFSLLEMRVVLSTLLSRMRIRAVDPVPEREARRLLVMSPARGAEVVLEPRHGSTIPER